MRKTSQNMFVGAMDSDSDPRSVADGNYYYALNLFNGKKARQGALFNDKGTVAGFYTPPAGTNTFIGACEDKQNRTVIGFLHNDNLDHRIIRYYPDINFSFEVAAGPSLGFDLSRRIHSAHVIDGHILEWTDGFSDENTITGEEPRMLDMALSVLDNKNLAYELFAGLPDNGQFANLKTYTFNIRDFSGTLFATDGFSADGTYLDDPAGGLEWLSVQLLASGLNDWLNIEACDCKLKINLESPYVQLEIVTSDAQVLLVPSNFICCPITDMQPYHYAMKRETADCAPDPEYIALPDIARNNVRDGCFQFRARYIYTGGQASHWSAVSIQALNNAEFGPPQESLNCIHLDFTDPRLNDVSWLAIIKFVELAFRDGNDEVFRLIKRIPICEIGSIVQEFNFLNDALYNVVASDDLSLSDAGVQVLTNFHNVPRITGSLSPIAGTDGNLRTQHSATLEGYECPDCVDADLFATTVESEDLVDIHGTVEIVNDSRAFDTDMRFPNYELGGFVVYLAGTNHFAISDNPLDGTGTGEFTITGVPRGVYSLRVASYMCRYDDSLGPRYNLSNGLVWQRTSSPVVDCCGAVAFNGYQHERTINLYGFVGPTFDLDTEVGYGPLQIQNCHHIQATPGAGTINLCEAYCMDNDGDYLELPARLSATSVERRIVQFRVGSAAGFLPVGDPTFPSPVEHSDHNGYAFTSLRLDVSGGTDRVRFIVPDWGGDDMTSPQPYPVFAAADADFMDKENGWHVITENTAIDYRLFPGDDSNTVIYQADLDSWTVFAYQADPAWTLANKATVSGKAEDANGVGLAGVLIWMVANGRWEYTNFAGDYSIKTYGTSAGVRSILQVLYATYPPDTGGLFEPVPPDDNHGFALDGDGDGIADTWTPPDFVFGFSGGILYGERFLKSGGIYKFGIVYEDDFGRNCGVSPIGTLDIPFHTSDGQYVPRSATWAIHSLPPLWATKYRIVRTKDTFYLTHKQTPVGKVQYAVIPDGVTDPTFTTYSSGDATHILLSIPTTKLDVTVPAGTLMLMFNGQRVNGYQAKKGDRVRYVLDETYATVFNDAVLEVDVEGEYVEGNDYYVIIPYTEINREVLKGWVFEFFTPKGFEEEIYYETGVCLPVGAFGDPARYHTGITQDQNPIGPLPATGPALTGDTYWWREQFVFSSDFGAQLVTENWRRSKFVSARYEDIGRPFLYDPNAGEAFYHNRIRFSGTFVPASQVNDLNSYGAVDYQHINRTFGPIKWAACLHDVLLCICQNKTQPVYVGKGRTVDLTGNTLVGRSDSILSVGNETVSDAGTLNPESVAVQDGRAWWWDLQNAKVQQYAANGINDINFGKNTYFRARYDDRLLVPRSADRVIGGYDRKHDLYFLTFHPASYVVEGETFTLLEDTLSYDVYDGGWRSHHSFVPDCYSSLNSEQVLLKDGVLWLNYKGTVNNFFGTQYKSKIVAIVNDSPQEQKDWYCIRVQASGLWNAPEISTISGREYAGGMASKLTDANFVMKENYFFADFLRDMNDPGAEFVAISPDDVRRATAALRGRHLKGEIMYVTLETSTGPLANVLWAVQIDFSDSQVTP